MQGSPAIVIQEDDIKRMLIEAGKIAAQEVVDELKADLNQDPVAKHILLLRSYLSDRSIIANPRCHWASGRHIMMIAPAKSNKPKSYSWFQRFKNESGLSECGSRNAPEHGRLREWCFEDIANAWDNFYRQRWIGKA